MLMRVDTEMYNKSVLAMENFIPTLQGTAERTPGTRFILDTEVLNARVIPFLSPANERSLVLLSDGAINLYSNITNYAAAGEGGGSSIVYKNPVLPNGAIDNGPEPWVMDPPRYVSHGDNLGCEYDWRDDGKIRGTCRKWTHALEKTYCRITNEAEITEPTPYITVNFSLFYKINFTSPDAGYTCTVKVGTTYDDDDVYTFDFTGTAGTLHEVTEEVAMPADATWGNLDGTGTLYVQVYIEAEETNSEKYSTPQFELNYFYILANATIEIGDETIYAPVVPYTDDEIADVHYVQSPYSADPSTPLAPSKPIVFTHPSHEPFWLFFNTDAAMIDPNDGVSLVPVGYCFIPIAFTFQPSAWTTGNYPATCTSYLGRLILGGSQSVPIVGSPTGPNSETCWGTIVGQWDTFTDPSTDPFTDSDSIEFTAIYRSPIQWLYGHKDLLVGAQEMEYSVQGDNNIIVPSDIGVFLQSTHGSNNVQPVGFGDSVFFAAEGGTKCRSLKLNRDDEGWIAPDLTFYNPGILRTRIVRMARMRNPHQMLVALTGNGQLALLHHDQYAGVSGWSRINLNAKIVDICVLSAENGLDVLYMLVLRNINGEKKLYLEAIINWADSNVRDYLASTLKFNAIGGATSTITGLDHLEGQLVQVVANSNFLGTYEVASGSIDLVDQSGNPYEVSQATVGLAMVSKLQLLPPQAVDPGAQKRYTDVNVRVRGSTLPIINGERPSDRSPETLMSQSEYPVLVDDVKVVNLGSDLYQLINIEENVPLRCEVIGVYGVVTESSL